MRSRFSSSERGERARRPDVFAGSSRWLSRLWVLGLAAFSEPVRAQESAPELGVEEPAVDAPVEFGFAYVSQFWANVAGGVRRGEVLQGNLDLLATVDLERLVHWEGARFHVHLLGQHGGSISRDVGDLQFVSNIESPDTAVVYEAWLEDAWQDGRYSLRAGLYDVNTEFDVLPAGLVFVHSAHGMGSEFGNSGRNGPSSFPATSVSVRGNAWIDESLYARFVVADGVPGDLDDAGETRIAFDEGDGLLIATEVGFDSEGSDLEPVETDPRLSGGAQSGLDKLAIGAWTYTGEFEDFHRVDSNGLPVERRGSWGAYVLGQHAFLRDSEDRDRRLRAFGRAGLADGETSAFDAYLGGGLVYRGLLPERPEDSLGFGIAAGHVSPAFRRGAFSSASATPGWEVVFEITYEVSLCEFLTIQPDLQYVHQPLGVAGADDALLLGLRLVLSR